MERRRALVTGASSGIGREFMRQLAAGGYTLTGVARTRQALNELVDALPGDGHRCLVADLTCEGDLQRVMAVLAEEHMELLVNNAGRGLIEPFHGSVLEEQLQMLSLNCAAQVRLAHAFLAQSRRGDSLINVGSIVSFLPVPAQPVYSATKAFIAAFSECLWAEQRERGVYVMGLCPGITRTEFFATATRDAADGSSMPAVLVQNTSAVVAEALRALGRRRRAIVVTGRVNRLMLWLPRLLSRQRLLQTLATLGDPRRSLFS